MSQPFRPTLHRQSLERFQSQILESPATTAVSVMAPVRFAVVRNMSGIVSTARRMPMPSTGRFAAASTGTIATMLPPGMPGTANVAMTTARIADSSCGVVSATPQLLSAILAVVIATFAVPGIPGGSIVAMVPVLAAANLPVEGIGILLAVDTIPDMFRTTANLTGAMTLTAVVAGDSKI